MTLPLPTWDTDVFLPVARRVIRRRLKDLLPTINHEGEREQYVEDEALSLAVKLAESAADRIEDLRDDLARNERLRVIA